MNEYAKKPENTSRTLDSNPKASKQASISQILQAYKDRIEGKPVQRQSINEEELLQAKATQQDHIKAVLQRYRERNIQRYAPEEDEELIQGKFDTEQREEIDEEEILQGKFESDTQTGQEPVQREEKPNNTGLPDNLKAGIENLSGYNMDDVKVHYNSDKPTQLNALAFAQGTDIHVAPGQEQHLPHEAWHVVQQKQGRVQPTMQMQGVNVNVNEGLEKEAEVMGNNGSGIYNKTFINRKTQENNTKEIVQLVSPKIAKLKSDATTKNAMMKLISEGIQMGRLFNASKDDAKKNIRINMILAGKLQKIKLKEIPSKLRRYLNVGLDEVTEDQDIDITPLEAIKVLTEGKAEKDNNIVLAIISELKSIPSIDIEKISLETIKPFIDYTQEKYMYVTGLAKENKMYSKVTGKDETMSVDDINKGKIALNNLINNWELMPKSNIQKVYRVVHVNTGEDKLKKDESWVKMNPTSSSVVLDWSRAEENKTYCEIEIISGDIFPLDLRAISTYTHEGEVLLPPGTTFTKTGKNELYTSFTATMPSKETLTSFLQ